MENLCAHQESTFIMEKLRLILEKNPLLSKREVFTHVSRTWQNYVEEEELFLSVTKYPCNITSGSIEL